MDIFKTLVVGSPPSRTYTASAVGLLTAANNLSDVADAATARTNIGLGTGNSPTFTNLTCSGTITTTGAVTIGGSLTVNGTGTQSFAGGKLTINGSNGFLSVGNGTVDAEVRIDRATSAGNNGIRWLTAGTQNWVVGSGFIGGSNTNWQLYNYGASNLAIDINYTTSAVALAGTLAISGTSATFSSGSGSPEGVVTAAVGSIYTRTNGGASTTLYVKESGAGNTGWVAK